VAGLGYAAAAFGFDVVGPGNAQPAAAVNPGREGHLEPPHLAPAPLAAADQWLRFYARFWTEQLDALQAEDVKLSQTWYIEQEARNQLHMCFPQEQCYEVVSGQSAKASVAAPQAAADPWYAKLWESVQRADATNQK